MLARRAAERRSLSDAKVLWDIHAHYAAAVLQSDASTAVAYNIEFHKRLYAFAGNPEAEQLLEGRTRVVRTFAQTLDSYVPENRQPVIAEHELIIKTFAAGDAEGCGKAVFEHVTKARDRLLKRLARAEPGLW
jgi:DNA-binding GntR family transcriptional regulator